MKFTFLKRLQRTYGDDLILHGSYARHLILGEGTFRDIDVLVMDETRNVMRMLDKADIRYTVSCDMLNPVFRRIVVHDEGMRYDILTQRLGFMDKAKLEDYFGRFPDCKVKAMIIDGKPNVSPEWLRENIGQPNPDFSYKWFSKKHDRTFLRYKYGDFPEPPLGTRGQDYQGSSKMMAARTVAAYQHWIPKAEQGNPYAIFMRDLWQSKYTKAKLAE